MEAAGYDAGPYQIEAMEHGWNEEPVGPDYANALAAKYFNDRKHTIFAGSNEIQRNIIAKAGAGPLTRPFPRPRTPPAPAKAGATPASPLCHPGPKDTIRSGIEK